jgi:GxxExxY protein
MKHRSTDVTEVFTEDLQEQIRARYHDRQPLPPNYNDLTRVVIGAAIQVHRTLGPGFLESTYQAAMCVELGRRGIPFQQQVEFSVVYEGVRVSTSVLDLVIDEILVVELKAVESIAMIHRMQLHSYLKAGGFLLGLIVNFNVVQIRDGLARVIETPLRNDPP